MAALFLLQTLVGAASQHYRAEIDNFFGFDLAQVFPYNLMRIVVDFPAPFGPTKPVTDPAGTPKLRSSTAVRRPNRFVRCSASIGCVIAITVRAGALAVVARRSTLLHAASERRQLAVSPSRGRLQSAPGGDARRPVQRDNCVDEFRSP